MGEASYAEEEVQVDKNVKPVEKSRAEVIRQESEAEGHRDTQIPATRKGTEVAEDGRAVEESMNIRGNIIMSSNPKKQVGGFDANHLDEVANHEAGNDRSIGYLGKVFEVDHLLGPERNFFDGLIKVKTVDDGLDHEKSVGPQKEKGPDLEDKLNPKTEKLPAHKVKSEFLKVVAAIQELVVSRETGCGKTTQLPQFILEEEISSLRGCNSCFPFDSMYGISVGAISKFLNIAK
ncbi:hypothetical protein L6452_40389 [Arctium lappa]|uniref:Uncharacterized protein n=1 Tax=Arctium lappa TaxID=4217 RepID=A0ACB8XM54_ARCLA|nr:hypothetical protein L6452_40389 [Arctium lappa]